jgi:alkaline phosphatase
MPGMIKFMACCGLFGLLMAVAPVAAESPAGWYADGERLVAERRAGYRDIRPARNVILFVGDGLSLATVAAARILEGQLRGESGEENLLSFERFPHLALAKTYNTNQQTPDSAGTMTAMTTGVKSFAGAIAVDQLARRGDCASAQERERVTVLDLASLGGMGTGVVTNTRITHATPAALFARSPERRWESDSGVPASASEQGCVDIAVQMIEYDIGGGIDVIFGGGRRALLPAVKPDPEYRSVRGHRADGRNLLTEWQERHPDGRYVWNLEQFKNLSLGSDGPILGLFEPGHMQYEHDRRDDQAGEPSLAEMTRAALKILNESENGFFLMVEGGRIDHAHHVNNAWRALTETIAFADAVRVAGELTDSEETLIIVTSDHGHALTFGNYGERGNPVMGLAVRPGDGPPEDRLMRDTAGVPLTVLKYASGPGYRGGQRPDYARVVPEHPDFVQEGTVNLRSSAHSGEDVPVYATGPGAEPLHGVIEQHVIFHAMIQAVPVLAETAGQVMNEEGLPDWRKLRELNDQRWRQPPCALAPMLTPGDC